MTAVVSRTELDMILQRNPALRVRNAECGVRSDSQQIKRIERIDGQSGRSGKDGQGRPSSCGQMGRMNRYERKVFDRIQVGCYNGRYSTCKFEGINLRLADKTYYKPDIDVWDLNDRLFFVEVKGPFKREDSMIKLKMAAEQFPLCQFWLFEFKDGLDGQMTPRLIPGYRGSAECRMQSAE